MPKQSLEFTGLLSTGAVADYLEQLARALREGHIIIESSGDLLEMELAPDVTLDLEAKADADKSKFAFEIRLDWRLPKRQPTATASLSIRSTAPSSPGESPEGGYGVDSANLD